MTPPWEEFEIDDDDGEISRSPVAAERREAESAALRQPAASVGIVPEARLRHDGVRDRGWKA